MPLFMCSYLANPVAKQFGPAMCRLKSIWAECVPSEVEKKKKSAFLLYFLLGDMDYSAKETKAFEASSLK